MTRNPVYALRSIHHRERARTAGLVAAWALIVLLAAARPAEGQQASPTKPAPRTDRYGDPLPPGAFARLGTVRLRHFRGIATFTADGKSLISVGLDPTARVWDPATGKELRRIRLELPDSRHFAYSVVLSADGKTLAAFNDGWIYILDLATGKQLRRIAVLPRERDSVRYELGLSPDGKTMSEAVYEPGSRPTVRLWDTATGNPGHSLALKVPAGVVASSPDCKVVAAASRGTEVTVWNVATGKQVCSLPALGLGDCAAFSPDGKLLATGGKAGMTLWELATAREMTKLRDVDDWIWSVSFSPDGTLLVLGGEKGVSVWDVAGRKRLYDVRPGHFGRSEPHFSPDGKTLIIGGMVIRLVNVATGKSIHQLDGHLGWVDKLVFSMDGRSLASFSSIDVDEGMLWDVASSKALHVFPRHDPHHSFERSSQIAAFSADGRLLISGGVDGIVRFRDVRSGKEVRNVTLQSGLVGKQAQFVHAALFSDDGRRLTAVTATGNRRSSDFGVSVWDMTTGKRVLQHKLFGESGFALSPDGELVTARGKGDLALFEVASGQHLATFEGNLDASTLFSPDGRTVAAVSWDGGKPQEGGERRSKHTVFLFETATRKEFLRIEMVSDRSLGWGNILFSPDGRVLVVAFGDTFGVWDVATGKETLHRSHADATRFKCIALAPDGRTLATGGLDGNILLWDLTEGLNRLGMPGRDLSTKDLENLWTDLAADADRAHPAIWTLVAAPKKAVPLLAQRLKPVPPIDPQPVQKLLRDLESPRFAVRDAALTKLKEIAEQAEPILQKALEEKPPLELRRRIMEVLPQKHVVRSPEMLRSVRAVQVLEEIGNPEARRILEELAGGVATARLTKEARTALERLGRRVEGQ